MPIDSTERIKFLNQIHLFNGLDEAQMATVAGEFKEETFSAGKEIIPLGAENDRLFLVWTGKVVVSRSGKRPISATFVTGDHFGEEGMLGGHQRQSIFAKALEPTTVLELDRSQFQNLSKQAPTLKTNITVALNSHSLEQQVHFKWLQDNELVYYLARKNSVLLIEGLTPPLLLEIAAVAGLLVTWYYSLWVPALAALWYVSLLLCVFAAGWGVWNGIDWSNDYYIVTDRRLVWVEKVVGLYESRQETPLSAVLRVNVDTDLYGRFLDYGTLVISTIVGSTLKLRNIDHPYQAAALIDQYWKRSKDTARKMDQEEIQKALRSRLIGDQTAVPEKTSVVTKPVAANNPYQGQRGIINLFRLRFEDFATVTYRKHIFVLIEQVWKPVLVMFILFAFLFFEIFRPHANIAALFKAETGLIYFIWAVLYLASLIWGIYEYIDWSNDIFQVTPEQIMDIDKTPLGEVTSDIASLENILSIEYKRIGILALLFNYGTVYITIGGGREMHFENVFNPSAVQEDIERRRLERVTKKEQDAILAERERNADWFAAYFKNEQQFRQEQGAPGANNPDDISPINEVK
jgi:hypothetical protein